MIGDDKLVHNGICQSPSQSPQKSFNIKKVNEFKNKVMVSAQKTVELQLKKKEQDFHFHLKPSSVKSNQIHKQSIDKVLVATKCRIDNK